MPNRSHRPLARVVWIAALAVCSALATAGPVWAQATDGPAIPAPAESDRAMVASIVADEVSAVQLCALAEQKSGDEDVRRLCRRMADTEARAALAGLTLEQRLGLPAATVEAAPDGAAALADLQRYSGADFDRRFLLARIASDAEDEHRLRYAAEVAADRAVQRYERAVLPQIEDDLDRSETALRRLSESTP